MTTMLGQLDLTCQVRLAYDLSMTAKTDREIVISFLRAEYGPSVSDATLAATADEMSAEETASLVAAVKAQPWLGE